MVHVCFVAAAPDGAEAAKRLGLPAGWKAAAKSRPSDPKKWDFVLTRGGRLRGGAPALERLRRRPPRRKKRLRGACGGIAGRLR